MVKGTLLLLASRAEHRGSRERCDCGGYWFPHRKGGGACDHSPRKEFFLAVRAGMETAEAHALLSADQLERMCPL